MSLKEEEEDKKEMFFIPLFRRVEGGGGGGYGVQSPLGSEKKSWGYLGLSFGG